MSAVTVFGLCAAAAVGLGLYGLITNPQPLRKIIAFNLLGSGVFLLFGVVGRRGRRSGLWQRPGAAGPGDHRSRGRVFRNGSGDRLVAAAFSDRRLHDAQQSGGGEPALRSVRSLMLPPAPALVTTAGGFLLVLSIVVPVAGVLLAFALGERYVRQVAFRSYRSGWRLLSPFSCSCRGATATSSTCSAPGHRRSAWPSARTDCRR